VAWAQKGSHEWVIERNGQLEGDTGNIPKQIALQFAEGMAFFEKVGELEGGLNTETVANVRELQV
jgi:hypothetical protein